MKPGKIDVVRKFVGSAKTDLEAGLRLFNEDQFDYFFNSLVLFTLAIEKLVKARIYLAHPVLLKKSTKPDEVLQHIMNPLAFCERFISDNQQDFVGLDEAWKRLLALEQQFAAFNPLLTDLRRYRNHHVHTYAETPSEIAMKCAFVGVWELCDLLLEDIDGATGSNSEFVVEKIIADEIAEGLAHLSTEFEPIAEFETTKQKNKSWLETKKDPTATELLNFNGGGTGTIVADVACPFCLNDDGFTDAVIEADQRTDLEGDAVFWEPPESLSAEFSSFGCLSCGAFVDSDSVLEKLGKEADSVKPPFILFEWSMDDGISDLKASYPDKKGAADGVEVLWS